MKRAAVIALLLCLVLCACASRERFAYSAAPDNGAAVPDTGKAVPDTAEPDPDTAETAPADFGEADVSALVGTWVNAGRYTEGREFVETMVLDEDGSLQVHLDYRGSPYADLQGSWILEEDTLTFTMSDGTLRIYQFVIDGDSLTLTGNGKTVEYLRR